jgi:hypothetical protein
MFLSASTKTSEQPATNFGHDILLIINYNHAYYESVELLKKIYKPYFGHIIFYGPQASNDVEYSDHFMGWFSYKIIAHAMQKYPQYSGYLYIHDDLIINPKNFERFDKSKFWINPPKKVNLDLGMDAVHDWPWWQHQVGYPAMKQVYDNMTQEDRDLLEKNIGAHTVSISYTDIAYIPALYTQQFIKLSNLCDQYKLFLEIALPTICTGLGGPGQLELIKGTTLWYDGSRNNPCDYLNQSTDYVHPIKLSNPAYREFVARYFEKL